MDLEKNPERKKSKARLPAKEEKRKSWICESMNKRDILVCNSLPRQDDDVDGDGLF